MHFVIKNPAPRGDDAHRWGDEYFGRALEDALVEAGCSVRQDYWPDWEQPSTDAAVLVLRGARRWLAPAGGFRMLWIISHPTEVDDEELDHYDLVLAASRVHARLLASRTRTPVRAALQCTDERVFQPPQLPIARQVEARQGTVYVANTRGARREMGQWLLDSGREARLFGRAWEYCGLGHMVEAQHLPNPEVAELYRQSRLALNDHWLAMRGLGYINNRLFDCLACGIPVITDESPEVRAVFGDALFYVGSGEELEAAMRACENDYGAMLQRVDEARQRLIDDFTFRARARELMEWVERPPDASKPRLGASRLPLEGRLERLLRTEVTQAERGAVRLQKALREEEIALARANKRLEKAEQERERSRQRALAAEAARKETLAELEQVREETLAELEQVRAEARDQAQLAAVALRHSERVERLLRDILASASWRITAPLRVVTGLVRLVVHGHRGAPVRGLPKRPAEVDRLAERLDMEPHRTRGKRSRATGPPAGVRGQPASLRARLVPLASRALRLAKRSTQQWRAGGTVPAGTPGSEETRKPVGVSPGEPARADGAASDDAEYWRLQAYQLLEELEYLRAGAAEQDRTPGSSSRLQPESARCDPADAASSTGD